MDLVDMGCEGADWILLAWDGDRRRALGNVVISLRIPWGEGVGGWGTKSFFII
jgi:hypothetical protein